MFHCFLFLDTPHHAGIKMNYRIIYDNWDIITYIEMYRWGRYKAAHFMGSI